MPQGERPPVLPQGGSGKSLYPFRCHRSGGSGRAEGCRRAGRGLLRLEEDRG